MYVSQKAPDQSNLRDFVRSNPDTAISFGSVTSTTRTRCSPFLPSSGCAAPSTFPGLIGVNELMAEEFRVVWMREGAREEKRKRYATRRGAERFMTLLGPEPWLAFGRDADEYVCCYGRECTCDGVTVREDVAVRREGMPPIVYVRLQKRPSLEWEDATYTLLSDGDDV